MTHDEAHGWLEAVRAGSDMATAGFRRNSLTKV